MLSKLTEYMGQTELKFEITLVSSYTKEELSQVQSWLNSYIENLVDQHCEIDFFRIKEI